MAELFSSVGSVAPSEDSYTKNLRDKLQYQERKIEGYNTTIKELQAMDMDEDPGEHGGLSTRITYTYTTKRITSAYN